MIPLVLWALSGVAALLSIPVPNGCPLILLAVMLYAAAWCCYYPEENR